MEALPGIQYITEAQEKWRQAHRKAIQAQVMASLEGQEDAGELLDFNAVAQRLRLKHAVYRGVQNIPIEKIIGSVGRYQDFTRAFLPVSADMQQRWQRVAAIYLDPTSGGVPPIEVYKVGSAYFVKDGNHRVSVARQLGMKDIEAYVWEYPEPVEGLSPDADIDALILEAERREFFERTRLDERRPGHGIHLTAPGGYLMMLAQIDAYQRALEQIDGRQVPYEEAVAAWYDMIYETTVQLIEETGVLALFPERTPADFYVWIKAHHEQLRERYHKRIMIDEVARDFRKRRRPSPVTRLWRAFLSRLAAHLSPT